MSLFFASKVRLFVGGARLSSAAAQVLGRVQIRGLLILLALLLPSSLRGHAPSDTFLYFKLTPTNLTGRWEIKLRDLQHAMGLDNIDPAAINVEQLRLREEALALDTLSGLRVRMDDRPAVIQLIDEQLVTGRDGDAFVLSFQSGSWTNQPTEFELHAQILFALDPQIRCIMRLEYWATPQQAILKADRPILKLSLRAAPSKAEQLLDFIREGIWHIWTGYDHILFLISLLLPAVLIWHHKPVAPTGSPSPFNGDEMCHEAYSFRSGEWTGAMSLKPVLVNVLKIVTAFTIAHSLTLALAALHVIELPTRWVESAIAASVIAAALNNLRPVVRERSWLVAFAFGLIHGFGFANVLAEAGLTKGSLAMALIGFNVGVEIGQLAIVAVLVPLAYRFRHTIGYRRVILGGGSVIVIVVSSIWLLERLFIFKLLPF